MITYIMIEIIHVAGSLLCALLARWVMGLSTLEKDIQWLERQKWYLSIRRLSFFRGLEARHQWRGLRILKQL